MNSALWKTCIGGFATAVFCAATCVTSFGAEAKSLEDMEKELNSLKATISGLTEQMELVKQEKAVAAASDTKEDVAALKSEVSTLKEEMRVAAEGAPAMKAEDIAGNVYSEFAKKVKLGGQVRTRAEYANGFYQGVANNGTLNGANTSVAATGGVRSRVNAVDDSYVLNQTRLWADADVNEHLRVFIQFQDARTFGSEGSTVGYASSGGGAANGSGGGENSMIDLHQGYFDLRKLFDMPLTVRVGRQEIVWGDHRVLGNFVWSNVGRVFDAGRFMWDTDTIHAEAFAAKVDEDGFFVGSEGAGTANPGNGSSDENVYAAQLAFKKLVPSALLELMYICKSDQDDTAGAGTTLSGTGNAALAGSVTNIHDFGARIDGKVPNLDAMDYTLESHVQVGTYGTAAQEAWAFAGKTGYTLKNVAWTPRFGIEYDYASGDSDTTDGTHETFDNLYPTNHWQGIYGFADLVSWQNMHDFRGQVKVSPTKKLTAQVDYHYFLLAEESDGWYLANATLAAPRANKAGVGTSYDTSDDELAQEFDLTVSYDLYKNVKILAGYSYFAAGDWIENNIGDTDTNWAYLQTTVTF
ncbi:MAG: putative outer rane protein [Candidatus Brocadiaceae bacterium]|nr:putative outer rane protein [Candidatus Brocadiaceae bacterium]